MERKAQRTGRPTKPAMPGTRYSLGLKVTGEVKKRLEQAASAVGRTQSQEAELRLQRSFDREDDLVEKWGEDIFNIADSTWRSLWHIERHTGKRWVEDKRTYQLFLNTVAEIIRNYRERILRERRVPPEGLFEGKSDQELAEIFARLGGITPLRPRHGERADRERDAAERADSINKWKKAIDDVQARALAPDGRDGSINGDKS